MRIDPSTRCDSSRPLPLASHHASAVQSTCPVSLIRKGIAMTRTSLLTCLILFAAALVAAAEDAKNLLKPTNKPDSWRFEQHDSAKGNMAADDDAIVFDVTETDGT